MQAHSDTSTLDQKEVNMSCCSQISTVNDLSDTAVTLIQNERLWLAQKIRWSSIHPSTGEIIPAPFRTSGFIVFGTPLVVNMLVAKTPLHTVFAQCLNQSHNAAVNWSYKRHDLSFFHLKAVSTHIANHHYQVQSECIRNR